MTTTLLFTLTDKDKVNIFTDILTNIKQISSYVLFIIHDKYIHIQGVSEDNHNIYEIKLTESWFDYYIDIETFKSIKQTSTFFSLKSQELKDVLRYCSCKHGIQFSIKSNPETLDIHCVKLEFNITTPTNHFEMNKMFSIKTYDIEKDMYDIKPQHPDVSFIISCDFRNMIKELFPYGENIIFKCYNDRIEFTLDNIEVFEDVRYLLPIQCINNYRHHLTETETDKDKDNHFTIKYNIETLYSAMLFHSICSNIQINMKEHYPLQIQYLFDNSDVNMIDPNIVHTFVSPIVDDDGDVNSDDDDSDSHDYSCNENNSHNDKQIPIPENDNHEIVNNYDHDMEMN